MSSVEVICSLGALLALHAAEPLHPGMSYGHIDESTLEIIIWVGDPERELASDAGYEVFMMLSIFSSNLMTYNHQIFRRSVKEKRLHAKTIGKGKETVVSGRWPGSPERRRYGAYDIRDLFPDAFCCPDSEASWNRRK